VPPHQAIGKDGVLRTFYLGRQASKPGAPNLNFSSSKDYKYEPVTPVKISSYVLEIKFEEDVEKN
jgi:hypothetical protein